MRSAEQFISGENAGKKRRGGVVERTEIGSHPLGCTDKKGATQSSHLHLVVGCTGPEALLSGFCGIH